MSTTIDEKLAEFSAAVLADAQKLRAELEAKNERIKTSKINSVQDEYLGDAYEKIQSEINEIKKADNEKVQNAQNTLRRELLMKREEIINNVFAKVHDRLKEFRNTDEYTAWLERKLLEAVRVAGEGSAKVYVRADDEKKVNAIIDEHFGGTVKPVIESLENSELIGGIRVENADRAILVDFSFDELLSEAKSDFLQKSGLRID